MIPPAYAAHETNRLAALRGLELLDTPLEDRFERITRLASRLLNAPVAAISLVDSQRQWFKSIQGCNLSQTTRAVSFCGHAILQTDVMVVEDARRDPRFADNPLVTKDPHIVFYAGCPIRAADGSTIATICIVDQEPRALTEEDRQLIRDLAAITESEVNTTMQSGVQRELISQLDEMRRHSKVDSLTRVWNRGAVFDLLDAECADASRSDGQGICVLMADIDHFKQINDNHGHAGGDEVLRQVARRMLSALRPTDSLGRYGGEEFMIVLGRCETPEDGRAIAERVRERVGACTIQTQYGEIAATLSIGLVFHERPLPDQGLPLTRAADAALYLAKRKGRNRVEAREFDPSATDPMPSSRAA